VVVVSFVGGYQDCSVLRTPLNLFAHRATNSHGAPIVRSRTWISFRHLLSIFPPLTSVGNHGSFRSSTNRDPGFSHGSFRGDLINSTTLTRSITQFGYLTRNPTLGFGTLFPTTNPFGLAVLMIKWKYLVFRVVK